MPKSAILNLVGLHEESSTIELVEPQPKSRRLQLIHEILKQTNPNQKIWDIEFDTLEGSVYTNINLSNHQDLTKLIGLCGLKIGTLDLSNCGKIQLEDLNSSHIKKLIIKGCDIDSVEDIQHIPGLEELVLNKNQITQQERELLNRTYLFIKLTFVD